MQSQRGLLKSALYISQAEKFPLKLTSITKMYSLNPIAKLAINLGKSLRTTEIW